MASTLMALALLAALCGMALAVPGTFDDAAREYSVPGKEFDKIAADDFKSALFKGCIGKLDDCAKLKAIDSKKAPGGFAVAMNQFNYPILNYAGLTAGLLHYEKNGQNSFHTHFGGHELVTVIKGGPLRCEIVDSAGKVFTFNLALGETGFFPMGVPHLQQNTNQRETLAFQTFSSSNPGVQRLFPTMFNANPKLVAIGLNNQFSESDVLDIKSKLVPGFPLKK